MKLCIFGDGPAIPGTSRCIKHRRASGKRQGPNPYGRHHEDQARVVLRGDPVCHICGRGREAIPELGPFQADHVVPLSMGGLSTLANLKPAHRKCNIAKGGANRRRGG